MRDVLLVTGLIVFAIALRSTRSKGLRKLGALTLLAASFCIFYLPTRNGWLGSCGVVVWLFLPWVELLTRIRRMRLPVENRLGQIPIPNPSFFPNAREAAEAMEEEGFEHVSNCGWEWDGMRQYFQLYWNPEERAVAAVCLCEQADVAFAFIAISSQDDRQRIWRTTNFPFAPTLLKPPGVHWNHVPCGRNCFHQILADHQTYLRRMGIEQDQLMIPDPEEIEQYIEQEMRRQLEHNLSLGIIRLTSDGHFRYSFRGLFFLWGQFIKDMLRFC